MRNVWLAILAALALATPVSAQDADASLAGVRGLYETVRGYIMATAEQVPEDLYDYRPTEEVRTLGQILGHVANAGYLFCAPAGGMEQPQVGNAEELGSKAEIQAALEASFEYCDQAYGMDGSMVDEGVTFFGQPHTRLSVLSFNMAHDFEHYGNLVTYMRANGMVPPSSQGG
ncbi:MAG: DinB family protein [Gemmatimonadota bacterium]|jgi:uncharacterized damage-inducible protein DinB